ncbi:MAG: hypothetical protein NZO58_04455 [Gemmataceae bacterium]|nr:hypothetical protein [Gemmataceae bacterium]
MHIDFYGLNFITPRVTCYLWSPWRAAAIEHRLFDQVRHIDGIELEQDVDEIRAHLTDAKQWQQLLHAVARVLKGWQEEATDAGRERRSWRWLLEGDTDDHGYDHAGEPAGLWAFLRVAIDRGDYDQGEKGEDIDLNGFGLRIWPNR